MQESIDILQFFGVKKPLFVMSGLAGDDLNRFVNREELIIEDHFKAITTSGMRSRWWD